MDATTLLVSLRAIGVEVRAEGDRLRFHPRDRVTSSQVSALAGHKAEIMDLLATEAVVPVGAASDRSAGPASTPAPASTRITRSTAHVHPQGHCTGCEALPRDARSLLTWGRDNGYPSLPLSPGVGIAAGEMRWRAFVSWATADLLALAVEQVQAASRRRCVIHGCRSACAHGDPVYCQAHRQQADLGLLWAPYVGSDTTQEALHGPSEAPGATKGQKWTQGQGSSATRTDVLRSVASEDSVDVVIVPSDEPTSSGMTFMVLLDRLRDRGSQLYVAPDGRLHYVGQPLAPDDPIQIGINEHLVLLTEAFTYVPGGRCTADGCYRLRGKAGMATCADHQQIVSPGPLNTIA